MANAEEVYQEVKKIKHANFSCLVPNMKGFEKALELGVKEIAVFTSTSDSFNQRNTNSSVSKSFEIIEPVIQEALKNNIKVRGYVSTAFGCPYEGSIAPQKVLEVSSKLLELGCYEISLGDTIGVATPLLVNSTLELLKKNLELQRIALHFHDTRGMALSNVLVGLSHGISVFDSSAGGLGGCPYARGATGNLATEDLIYLLHSLNIETGVSLERLAMASRYIHEALGKKSTSKFLQSYLSSKDIS